MRSRKILASLFIFPALLALAACQEKEGPAEKAGKELDKAASALGESIENAGNSIRNAVIPPK
ncbi:MAG TPA: hypothetical protein VKY60_03710 [Burkholderiaceae bacterium]|nr:hypothetical protein [Burkholderiaceae bacterium]